MKVMRKTAVWGMLSVFAFASLFMLFSCSLDSIFSPDRTGEVEVALSIPPNIADKALPPALGQALVSPDSAASRFIHPDTRFVEVQIAINKGPKTMTGSVSVQAGSTSAVVRMKGVPMGDHTLTISLYDTSSRATLLSRGSSDLSVRPKSVLRANVTAVPITRNSFQPGPYGTYGVTVDASLSNQVIVYEVDIPRAGSYMLRCYNAANKTHEANDVALYDGQGRAVGAATAGSGATMGQYASLFAGTYYVVVEAPTLGRANYLEVSLNSDLRLTITGADIYVDPTISVMDRTRPFAIHVPSGYSGTPTVDFGGALGATTPAIALTDANTITVDPGADGLIPTSASTGISVAFTDALLGRSQANAVATTPAALRTFVYCNPGATVPSDSAAFGFPDIASAVTDNAHGTNYLARVEIGIPVLALSGSFTGVAAFGITNAVYVLGGFSLDGSRPAGHGYGNLTFANATNNISMSAGANNSVFDGVNFTVSADAPSAGGYPISVGADARFIDCSFRRTGALTLGAGNTYSLLYLTATYVTFDRCSILGSTMTLGSGSTVYAINDLASTGANLRISNSLVDPGALSATSSGGTVIGVGTISGTLSLSGSSVSAGQGSPATAPALRPVYLTGGCTLNAANDLLIGGDMRPANSAFVYSSGALTALNFDNMVLGYGSANASSYAIYVNSGSQIAFSAWPTDPSYGANPLDLTSKYSLASIDPANRFFLQPQASSPASLLLGGADLSDAVVRSDHHLSILDHWVSPYDRKGAARSGTGGTGYTIGAFEFD